MHSKLSPVLFLALFIIAIGNIGLFSIAKSDGEESHYPVNVVVDKVSFEDYSWVPNTYPNYNSTYNSMSTIEDGLINEGIGTLQEENYVSYYDNHLPYKLVNVFDASYIDLPSTLANIIKTSKVFMLAANTYKVHVTYDSNTHKLTISTEIVVNNHDIGIEELGYYDYMNNVPPDNTPTRVVILVSPFAGIVNKQDWIEYYASKMNAEINTVDINTPADGLYSIGTVIAFDYYPMIYPLPDQSIKYYEPGCFPLPYYDTLTPGTSANVVELRSPMVHLIHMLFSATDGISSGAKVKSALDNVLASNGPLALNNAYSTAYDILASSNIGISNYVGHYRVGIIWGINGSNTPLLTYNDNSGGGNSGDNGGGGSSGGGSGMICPPGGNCNQLTGDTIFKNHMI